jgi:Leucine-rich repeat (LRR) protein
MSQRKRESNRESLQAAAAVAATVGVPGAHAISGEDDETNGLQRPILVEDKEGPGNANDDMAARLSSSSVRVSMSQMKRESNRESLQAVAATAATVGVPGAHAISGEDDDRVDCNRAMSKDPRARHDYRASLVVTEETSPAKEDSENQSAKEGEEVEKNVAQIAIQPKPKRTRKPNARGRGSSKKEQNDVDDDDDNVGFQGLSLQTTTSVPGAHTVNGINFDRFNDDSSSSDSSFGGVWVDAASSVPPDLQFGTSPGVNSRSASMFGQARIDKQDIDDKLAIAIPIDEKEEYCDVIDTAKEYVPMEKPKVYQRRSFQAFLALFCLLAIGGAVGGVVAINKKKEKDAIVVIATPEPTAAPTAAPTASDEPIFRAFLDASMALPGRAFSPEAYDSAVRWLAGTDSLDRQPDDPLFEQRFVLAWLWYHTTKNGQEPWLSCNPPNDSGDNTCVFQNHTGISDDGSEVFYKEDNATRWLSGTSECTWPGIYCNEETGAVWAISLRGMNLQAEFPIFLGDLPELSYLELIFNKLDGELPVDFSSFNALTFFSVMNNTLSGTIPDSLYSIPNLGYLGLGNNHFSGQISPAISNASSVVQLYLHGNDFSGDLPDGIGKLSALQLLHMQRNPGFLGSTIPPSWGNLSQLKILWMYKNGLGGSIPQEFSNLQSLLGFRLQDNQLTGPLPSIQAPGLVQFEAAENLLNGTIPDSLYNSTSLQTLSFYKNRITGQLKPAIGNLLSLVYLAIYDNRLTGTIPVELSNMTSLKTIWMHYNQFDGAVPIEICNLRAPEKLSNLTSDCWRPVLSNGGDEDYNDCYCCTDCCDRVDRDCGPANFDRPGDGDRF